MKPEWLNKKIHLSTFDAMKKRLSPYKLHTVCEEAMCPNISECSARGTATFLIMGDVCTRGCTFCGVGRGTPEALDADEPSRVAAAAVDELGLRYVVVTSVTRDDLPDGGAAHFARTVRAIKDKDDTVAVELLIPDFDSLRDRVAAVVKSGADVIAHNVETVERLYPAVGREDYRYSVSMSVLETVKCIDKEAVTKSGLMLGLGETEEEVLQTFEDLLDVKCDYLSLGQFLPPSQSHYQVKEYVTPETFGRYRDIALKMGFKSVKSGPYVRSSYLADEYGK